MKDPKRLRDSTDAPDALREALQHLEHQSPPAATIARIQRTLINVPTPPHNVARTWTGPGSYIASTTVASLLAVTAFLQLPQHSEPRANKPRPVETAAPPITTPQDSEPQANSSQGLETSNAPQLTAANTTPRPGPATMPAPELTQESNMPPAPHAITLTVATAVVRAAANAQPLDADALSSAVTEPEAKRPEHWQATALTPKPKHREAQHLQPAALTSRPENKTTSRSQAASTPEPAPPKPLHSQATTLAPAATRQSLKHSQVAAPASAAPAPTPEDEASLMYRAKKAGRVDRQASLRMLELHRVHFPNGTLAEEREVLTIDLLRALGRDREATLRTIRFLERFPHSSYASALQP